MPVGNQDIVTRRDIEAWLKEIMIPVDPDEKFVQRLKARLVRVRGGLLSTGWAIIGAVAVATVVLMAIFGLALRAFLGLLSLVGLLERRPSSAGRKQASAA